MRPTHQPLQRTPLPQQIVYPQTARQPVVSPYVIFSKNGMAPIPQTATPNMIQMRPIATSQTLAQTNGAMPVINHDDYWDDQSYNNSCSHPNLPYSHQYQDSCSRSYYEQMSQQRMGYCYGQYPPYGSRQNYEDRRTLAQPGQTIVGPVVTTQSTVNQGAGRLNAFLKQLIDLSQRNVSPGTHSELIKLIQQLVDRQMSPDEFCSQLQAKLKCGTTNTRAEISSLVEENIDYLRCDLFYGHSTIPGINPPSKDSINDLLQRQHPGSGTIAQTTIYSAAPTRSSIIQTQGQTQRFAGQVTTAPPNATLVASVANPQQRFMVAAPSNANAPRATFYTGTATPAGATIVSTAGSIPSGPKFLISATGAQVPQTATLIPQHRLIAPGAGGTTMVVASGTAPGQTIFRPQNATTVRQEGGILTSIPVSGAKITSVSSLAQPSQSNLRPTLAPTVIAAKPEILDNTSLTTSDQPFFPINTVLARMKMHIPPGKVSVISEDSAAVLAHGLHTFTRNLLMRLALVVQHRTERLGDDPRLQVVDSVRDQLNFLQRLDEHDQARQSDIEKELIFKAARSRSKNEDPDQARVKEIAKRLQNEDYEREKQRQANLTALSAIGGPTRKRRLDEMDNFNLNASAVPGTASSLLAAKRNASNLLITPSSSSFNQLGPSGSRLSIGPAGHRAISGNSTSPQISGPRIGMVSSLNGTDSSTTGASALLRVKRANIKDLQFVLSKHSMLNKGSSYFRTYWR